MRNYLASLVILCLGCALAPGAGAGVSSEMQKAIRANTFEVVMKKPDSDNATYEKPLPMELLPFHERNDAYKSVGTAFALGHNTYVTAAHVFNVAIASQYGPPQLRASDNTVYSVDRILRYSLHEDYVVFSLLHDPAPAGFAVNADPQIDDPVLAVGNALGEGIVIRDGLYTSATDEDQDGLWKWIRFSAAASPGNSGGPLLDDAGRVIGIVIGKSPNENLNYSLPIGRALVVEEKVAKFNQRYLTGLPYLHVTDPYTIKGEFPLPLAWPAFVEAYQALLNRQNDAARAQLLSAHQDVLFPLGPGTDSLLSETDPNGFNPFLIIQQDDGAWGAARADFALTELPGDGSVSIAAAAGFSLLRLIRPNGASDDAFYSDSQAFMDLALKALNLRRPVGQDQVRITSLGPAKTNTWYTDPYKRIWQERVWAVPFLDIYVVGELLPTPDGYAAIMTYVPSGYLRECQSRLRLLTGQLGISMRGSLKQWREYLQRRSILPAAFSGVKLASTSGWTLESPQFTASIPSSALALTEDSLLTLTMGFTRNGSHAGWEVTDTWWFKDNRMEDGVGLWRRQNPPSGAKLELRNTFASMRERRAPYDGGMLRDSAETFSTTRILEVPGKSPGTVSADLLYALTLRMIGHPTLPDANRTMQTLIEGIRISERGVGDDIKGATSVNGHAVDHGEDDAWQRLISEAEKNDAAMGKDIRGHTYSQDLRNLYEAAKARAKTSVIVPLASALEEPMQSKPFQDLVEYWKNYPALSHNRDLWVSYLARNKMPLETSHDETVIAAENALTSALNGGSPTSEWAERAHALTAAYIAERNRRLTNHEVSSDDFRQRVSPCPAPAEKTLGAEKTPGKKPPSYSRMNRSLEDFWPPESKRLGEEGIVRVSIRISSEGCALAAAIVASSGSPMLDEAVLKFYETIDFHPGEIDGNAVEVTTTIPVNFKLRN